MFKNPFRKTALTNTKFYGLTFYVHFYIHICYTFSLGLIVEISGTFTATTLPLVAEGGWESARVLRAQYWAPLAVAEEACQAAGACLVLLLTPFGLGWHKGTRMGWKSRTYRDRVNISAFSSTG